MTLLTRPGAQRACTRGSGGVLLSEERPTVPPTHSPSGYMAGSSESLVLCDLGGGLLSETWSTVPSPSSPSSFSGGWSTGLKIPSFQQWVLPSDHQHPSRSPDQVTSTEQKTVLSVRKPLGLEEPCAGDWGMFAAISHFYQRAQRCRADEDGDCLWNNTSWSQAAS